MLRTLDKVGFETPRRRLSGLEMASSLLFSSPDRVGLTEFRARVGSGFTVLAAGRVGSGFITLQTFLQNQNEKLEKFQDILFL